MAEGGNAAPLKTLLNNANANTSVNPVAAEVALDPLEELPEGNPGFLAPGASTSLVLSTYDENNRLSFAAMVLPTNNGFAGLDSWKIPTEAGTYTINLNAYDAGTEANDEIIVKDTGGALGIPGIPGCPGGLCGENGSGVTSVESNTKVHIHRNTLGDSDLDGGISDLN